MEFGGSRKRPRVVDVDEFSLPSKLSVLSDCAELIAANSLPDVSSTREARRSDDSETLPIQKVDDDCPEIPANGATSMPDILSWHPLPSIGNVQISALWHGLPLPRPKELNLTALLSSLGGVRTPGLQYLLTLLDILEQDLLRDLRAARRQYDTRAAELCAPGLHGLAHAAVLHRQAPPSAMPVATSTSNALVGGLRSPRPQPMLRPPGSTLLVARHLAYFGTPMEITALYSPSYSSSKMPPPAPRAPRGGIGLNHQHHPRLREEQERQHPQFRPVHRAPKVAAVGPPRETGGVDDRCTEPRCQGVEPSCCGAYGRLGLAAYGSTARVEEAAGAAVSLSGSPSCLSRVKHRLRVGGPWTGNTGVELAASGLSEMPGELSGRWGGQLGRQRDESHRAVSHSLMSTVAVLTVSTVTVAVAVATYSPV